MKIASKEDGDRSNERTRELIADGFPPHEALGLAWEEVTGRRRYSETDESVRLTLLRASDDVSHQHESFQAEIKEFNNALKECGVESEAHWIAQDAVGGWCGLVGVIVATGATIKAARPIILAYMKRRTGRKVQIECNGHKLKIEEATEEEVGRVLALFEQRSTTKQKKT